MASPLPLRSLWLALLVVGLAGGCTRHADYTPPTPIVGIQTYESYDRSFTLAYPLDWAVVPVDVLPEGTTFSAVSPHERAELLVATKDLGAQPLSLETVLASVQLDYGANLRESGVTNLNGLEAVRVVADTVAGARPVRMLQYLVPDRGRLYYLTLRTRPDAFAARQADMEAIAATFRLR